MLETQLRLLQWTKIACRLLRCLHVHVYAATISPMNGMSSVYKATLGIFRMIFCIIHLKYLQLPLQCCRVDSCNGEIPSQCWWLLASLILPLTDTACTCVPYPTLRMMWLLIEMLQFCSCGQYVWVHLYMCCFICHQLIPTFPDKLIFLNQGITSAAQSENSTGSITSSSCRWSNSWLTLWWKENRTFLAL